MRHLYEICQMGQEESLVYSLQFTINSLQLTVKNVEFVKDEDSINNIWFYLIDIRRYWHFSSNITDDALTSSFCLVLFQKFGEIIQQTHQQQAFRFIHKKLQREQDNPSED